MPVRGRPGGLSTQPGPGAPRSASLGLHWLICKRGLFRAEAAGSRCEATRCCGQCLLGPLSAREKPLGSGSAL